MNRIVLATLICALTVSSAVAQCSESDVKALEQFDRDWGAASQNADRTKLTAIYADDYRNVVGNETKASAIDNAVTQANLNKANPAKAAKVSWDHYMITCTPSTATITHRNKIKLPPGADGRSEVQYSRSIHVLEKRNGKWQVVSNAGHPLNDEMILGYLEMDWVDAMTSRNADWFENNLSPEYIAANFSGELYGKETAVGNIKTTKMRFDKAKILDMDVKVNGSTAIVTGIGHGVGKDENGAPFDMKVRFMDTFIKRDGRWMPLASHTTPLRESQEPVATRSN